MTNLPDQLRDALQSGEYPCGVHRCPAVFEFEDLSDTSYEGACGLRRVDGTCAGEEDLFAALNEPPWCPMDDETSPQYALVMGKAFERRALRRLAEEAK
jgi:hypothetical protein